MGTLLDLARVTGDAMSLSEKTFSDRLMFLIKFNPLGRLACKYNERYKKIFNSKIYN